MMEMASKSSSSGSYRSRSSVALGCGTRAGALAVGTDPLSATCNSVCVAAVAASLARPASLPAAWISAIPVAVPVPSASSTIRSASFSISTPVSNAASWTLCTCIPSSPGSTDQPRCLAIARTRRRLYLAKFRRPSRKPKRQPVHPESSPSNQNPCRRKRESRVHHRPRTSRPKDSR